MHASVSDVKSLNYVSIHIVSSHCITVISCLPVNADVDECSRGIDLCLDSAKCEDTDGSYKCTCAQGLQQSEDGFGCIGVY